MSKENVLVLGAGVAGCSLAYFLQRKGYAVTVLEKDTYVGGMSRTYYYAGHPYEFGPHIWFWPDEKINDVIRELTDNHLYYIERKLFSYIEQDRRHYRYPVHYNDISGMPEAEQIRAELAINRDAELKLKVDQLPKLGNCTFADYFTAAIGNKLYAKFMENYTWKMWGIPGDELQTSMVWADMVKHRYEKLKGYDPLKFEDTTLGKGLAFQIYPTAGWNIVWERMIEGAELVTNCAVLGITRDGGGYYLKTSRGRYDFKDYHAVINTLDVDRLWGEDRLPYTGRMIAPLLLEGIEYALPEGAESIYYSGTECQTRVTEMKRVTRHQSPDTLLIIEIPVTGQSGAAFPDNVKINARFRPRAYPQQSETGIAMYDEYVAKGKPIKNLLHCGRYGNFKYWGMPETVNAAYQLVESYF